MYRVHRVHKQLTSKVEAIYEQCRSGLLMSATGKPVTVLKVSLAVRAVSLALKWLEDLWGRRHLLACGGWSDAHSEAAVTARTQCVPTTSTMVVSGFGPQQRISKGLEGEIIEATLEKDTHIATTASQIFGLPSLNLN